MTTIQSAALPLYNAVGSQCNRPLKKAYLPPACPKQAFRIVALDRFGNHYRSKRSREVTENYLAKRKKECYGPFGSSKTSSPLSEIRISHLSIPRNGNGLPSESHRLIKFCNLFRVIGRRHGSCKSPSGTKQLWCHFSHS